MGIVEVKEEQHDYIEHADDKKLQAIYTLLEKELEGDTYLYDEETLDMLEERREEYISGKVIGLSPEESIEFIKNEIKKRSL